MGTNSQFDSSRENEGLHASDSADKSAAQLSQTAAFPPRESELSPRQLRQIAALIAVNELLGNATKQLAASQLELLLELSLNENRPGPTESPRHTLLLAKVKEISPSVPDTEQLEVVRDIVRLVQRQTRQIKVLIREDTLLGDEVKRLASGHIELLLELIRDPARTEPTDSHHLSYLQEQLESFAFSFPPSDEIRELRDIVSQVENAPPPMEPEASAQFKMEMLEQAEQLTHPFNLHAIAALDVCGSRSPACQLALNFPEAFAATLRMTGEHLAAPQNADFLATLDQEILRLEALGIKGLLRRDLRLTLERLESIKEENEKADQDTQLNLEDDFDPEEALDSDQILGELAKKISRLKDPDQSIAASVLKEMGLCALSIIAVESVEAFAQYVESRFKRDTGVEDKDSADYCSFMEQELTNAGADIPTPEQIERCRNLIHTIRNDYDQKIIRLIQEEIDRAEQEFEDPE